MASSNPNIALITGATAGIGEAVARKFAERGVKLILVGRRIDRLRALAASLQTECHILELDICERAEVKRKFTAIPEKFSRIDVLVNNAGLALGMESSAEANLDDWDEMIDTNIKGLIYCARSILPGMVSRDRGHIINIGSIAGSYPYPGGNVYGGTKAFVHQFSLNLRADLLGTQVKVTCVEPGATKTEFLSVRFKGDVDKAENMLKGVNPMSPNDVAEVVCFVATAPKNVNINHLELMPVSQAFGPFAFARNSAG